MRRLRERLRNRVYFWIDFRGRLPFWTKWVWPGAHFCPEMDDLLILWNTFDCFCTVAGPVIGCCDYCGRENVR